MGENNTANYALAVTPLRHCKRKEETNQKAYQPLFHLLLSCSKFAGSLYARSLHLSQMRHSSQRTPIRRIHRDDGTGPFKPITCTADWPFYC